jgi:probable HAF family extracellular repeat protein
MHSLLKTVAALAVAATLLPLAQAGDDVPVTPPPRYRLQSLGVLPGDDNSTGYAINNEGAIAGGSFKPRREDGRLFLYRDGGLQALGSLRGDYARPWALNERGDIVGASADASGRLRPFLYRDGRMLDLAASLGAREGRALGLNAAGQAMGEADDHPFFYDGMSSRYLTSSTGGALRGFGTALNDAGVGVGGVLADSGYKTFVHEDGRLRLLANPEDYEGWGDFYGRDINNAGQILVNHMYTADDYGGTLIYDHGRYERIGGLSDFGIDINNKGWVLYDDSYFDPDWGDYNWTPALYRDGARAQLRDLLTPGSAAHWEVSAAYGLNDAGQIVGDGYFNGQLRAFIATPVPEPESAALLLAGLSLVGTAVRGRGRRAA